jgi:hypothetical protein
MVRMVLIYRTIVFLHQEEGSCLSKLHLHLGYLCSKFDDGFSAQDFDGNKMINEYVRESKIGTGSYGKVVLHRSKRDNRLYAIKIFHKSRLCKLRVSPTETAMMDVLREVSRQNFKLL